MHIDNDDVVTLARAINRSRPDASPNKALKRQDGWRNAQVDATARSIAEELFPHPTLTQDCTRRIFLLSAGLDEPASRVRPCSGKSGCASEPLPPGI